MAPEILAPAGEMPVLLAALDAGADAVYLGLRCLNARYGARNFLPEELEKAVELAHSRNVKVYLTLNTDLSERELGTAARALALAAKCGVDGVLIRDAAIFAFMPFFPQLQFHFSTQAGISTSAGVLISKELGISRVVLARELTMDEIRAATAIQGIETEVFVQGAICFCCSGRCLLSSWGGGRSGNRGRCTSPCRVSWSNIDGVEAHPMSMRDLCLADWCDALGSAGVASLKIEGRLKSPDWVSKAVTLYRHVLDHSWDMAKIHEEAERLGDYTGRDLTDGYVRGDRTLLTAVSGRVASKAIPEKENAPAESLNISVSDDGRDGTLWSFSFNDVSATHRTPPQRIASAKRAVSLKETTDALVQLAKRECIVNMQDAIAQRLMPKSASNAVCDAFQAFLRSLSKIDDGLPRGIALPDGLRELLSREPVPCEENSCRCGFEPNMARFGWNEKVDTKLPSILECAPTSIQDAEAQAEAVISRWMAIAALPQVMYEAQLEPVKRLLSILAKAGVAVEINSWDGLFLAREAGVAFSAGPGLGVLNSLAAKKLYDLGCQSVYVSQEIDRGQLEELCANAEVPLSMTIFGRIALMTTRAELPQLFANSPFKDSRGIVLEPEHSGGLTILRPAKPMDWRGLRNKSARVKNRVLDLHGYRSERVPQEPFMFNYDRRLR